MLIKIVEMTGPHYDEHIYWQELVSVINDLLAGHCIVAECCRTIARFEFLFSDSPKNIFNKFIGYSDLFDEFPLGQVRPLWNSEALVRADNERMMIEAAHQEGIFSEARQILEYIEQNKKTSALK